MKRYSIVAAAVLFAAVPAMFAQGGETLPTPKGGWKTSYDADVSEGERHKCKGKECCDFLCDIFLLNATGVKIKVMIRATIIGLPGYEIHLPAYCDGKSLTIKPCEHPWHRWFDEIKVSVWDGESTAKQVRPFYGCCKMRRYVAEYKHGELQLNER